MADDKPDFDPSLPFEPAASAATEKPSFDPSLPFEQAPQGEPSRPWSSVPLEAAKNVPASAMQFGKDIVQPIMHPVDTATNLGNLGKGVLQKLGVMSGEDATPYADAVGKFLVDRYGSMDAIKNTMANDPVGMAADLSMLVTGGGSAAARAPGIAGRVGEVVGKVGRTIDPLSAVSATARGATKLGTEVIGGLGTGTGGESVRAAARAGYEGGTAAQSFRENMRDVVPADEAVTEARGVVDKLRQQRGADYAAQRASITDPTILDFNKVDKAIASVAGVQKFKGVPISSGTEAIRKAITDIVDDWRGYAPAQYHTVWGFDALKQKIGDLKAVDPAEWKVKSAAYNAIKQTIQDQAPAYAKIMSGYEEASKQMKTLEQELSLGRNANVDTSLRKLQSVLRNNVNTAYGRRAELADFLVKNGAPNLMYKLAGQAMQPVLPRGLNKLGMQVGAEMLAIFGGHAAGMGGLGLATGAAMLPVMSPRVVGEGAYYAGKAAGYVPSAAIRPSGRATYQTGRFEDQGVPVRATGGRVLGSSEIASDPEHKHQGYDANAEPHGHALGHGDDVHQPGNAYDGNEHATSAFGHEGKKQEQPASDLSHPRIFRATGGRVNSPWHPAQTGAKKAKDGKWYLPDSDRPGRWLEVRRRAQ